MKYKLVVVVRKDLKISCGKICAQVGHAVAECIFSSNEEILEEWRREGQKKVILEVKDLNELLKIYQEAKNHGLNVCLIRDAGLTEVEPGTITVLGIGPDLEEKIDKVTGKLKLFKEYD